MLNTKQFTEKVLNKIPTSWKEVNLKQFNEAKVIRESEESEGTEDIVEKYHKLISVFSGLDYEYIVENLSYPQSLLSIERINKLLNERIDVYEYKNISTKKIEDITTNEYIFVMEAKEDKVYEVDFLYQLLNSFIYVDKKKYKIEKEEIENLNVQFIQTCFFLQLKMVEKYTKKSLYKQTMKIGKKKLKKKMFFWKKVKANSKS